MICKAAAATWLTAAAALLQVVQATVAPQMAARLAVLAMAAALRPPAGCQRMDQRERLALRHRSAIRIRHRHGSVDALPGISVLSASMAAR
ncbi:hypothetical protein JKP88DRAFT_227103 [Tribonema minus]|uniref:Secreted protein n=1 Tax=Tribonema minus TaxID=303371 RepID=A0A836C9E2_9STRA|nr:hypothetical protein JKP88DRAFT_227103 [Tribonema minus]